LSFFLQNTEGTVCLKISYKICYYASSVVVPKSLHIIKLILLSLIFLWCDINCYNHYIYKVDS